MTKQTKYLLIGTERSGSTLLASLLANADANFGFDKNKAWNRGSGDYEHKLIISAYKNVKRYLFYKKFSDSLANKEQRKAIAKIKEMFIAVDFAKYPPLSEYLPLFIKHANYDVRLIVIIRKFNDFAISRISKNGGDFETCKKIYLNMYRTTLLNLSLYGGCIVRYEDMIDIEATRWVEIIAETCALSTEKIIAERNKNAKPTAAVNSISKYFFDKDCEEIYEVYSKLTNSNYLPDAVKQHT